MYLLAPVKVSKPIVESNIPTEPARIPLKTFFSPNEQTIDKPRNANAKYSAGPNANATCESGIARNIKKTVLKIPPRHDEISER